MRRTAAALLMAGICGTAEAHSAPSGWSYDPWCCGGGDCAPVPDSAVRETRDGFVVLVLPGEHPMVMPGSPGVADSVPHNDQRLKQSGDQHVHVCVYGGRIRCVYLPPRTG